MLIQFILALHLGHLLGGVSFRRRGSAEFSYIKPLCNAHILQVFFMHGTINSDVTSHTDSVLISITTFFSSIILTIGFKVLAVCWSGEFIIIYKFDKHVFIDATPSYISNDP